MKTVAIERKSSADINAWMTNYLAAKLRIAPTAVDTGRMFGDYGIDSAAAMEMVGDLEDYLGHDLSPSLPYKYPTIVSLSNALAGPKDHSEA